MNADHWETVYTTKSPETVSWYAPHLRTSLELLEAAGLPRYARIVDVGGGASTLVDDLLDRGFTNLAVLDLSAAALARAQARLGARAARVDWIVGDATTYEHPAEQVDVWHDRAVFHFLTSETARAAYVTRVREAVRPGGHVIVATFGPNGPLRCSGLEVVRYDAEALHGTFGSSFRKVDSRTELHDTPAGGVQEFTYCWCRVG